MKLIDKKYMNITAYMENRYFAVDEIKQLKDYFERMNIVWASGLETPSMADKLAFLCFKDAFKAL